MDTTEDTSRKPAENRQELNVIALLKKMQHQLDLIEGKVNSLLYHMKENATKNREYQKPYREYDRNRPPKSRRYERGSDEASGDHKFYHGRPFDKKSAGKSTFRPGDKERFKSGYKKDKIPPKRPGKKS